MDYLNYTKKLERIRFLIEHKMTGTPGELAQKLEVSERTAKRMIAQLRESGLDIRYCRYENSYILEKYH